MVYYFVLVTNHYIINSSLLFTCNYNLIAIITYWPHQSVLELLLYTYWKLLTTMTNLQEVLDTQRALEESLGTRMALFEKMLQPSTGESASNLEKLTQDFLEFRQFAMDIFKLLRTQIDSLTSQIDEIDTYNRRNALLFHGLPESETEDCTATVINLINSTMTLKSVQASSIYLCHRLGSKNDKRARPILVRFTDVNIRNKIWGEKKLLKSSPAVVCEFLTRTRHDLFLSARKHFGVTSSWTSNGVVYVKTPDNVRSRVASAQELNKIIARFPIESSNTNIVSGPRSAAAARQKASPKMVGLASTSAVAAVPVEAPQTRRNIVARSKLIK